MGDLVTLQVAPAPALPESTFSEVPLTIRKAGLQDIGPLLLLINDYAAKGIMLPRTEFEMAENIRDFTIIYAGDQLVACAALHIYTPLAAEIRSLAVHPGWKSHGLGRKLLEYLEQEARLLGLKTLFAFTYVEGFFQKLGYKTVDRDALPLKAWKDCLRCPKFQACDEIAMLKDLQTT